VVLYTGQGKFHQSTTTTVDYVVSQANYTVDNLRNFSDSLAAAKKVDVDQVFLPSDVINQIDTAQTKLNSSANNLESRTLDNSRKIKKVLNSVYVFKILFVLVFNAVHPTFI
jgi:hypothetical protein